MHKIAHWMVSIGNVNSHQEPIVTRSQGLLNDGHEIWYVGTGLMGLSVHPPNRLTCYFQYGPSSHPQFHISTFENFSCSSRERAGLGSSSLSANRPSQPPDLGITIWGSFFSVFYLKRLP